ncbi:MAG TPA: lactate utilization protein [Dissulfurispiraceae bacterium]|nr:lactate utilization protein [Dissulfurispiraceae bacterium]
MFESFMTKAIAAGNTEVQRFGTKAEALDFVVQFMQKEGVSDSAGSYGVWAACPFLDGMDKSGIAQRLPGLKFEFTRETAKQAKVGVTQMDWGVANTGTLAQDSTKVDQRLASALPWIHVMLLPSTNIVADLPALFSKVDPKKSNYIALITGPSKTADIERVLAIGVHGPERVVIVCVDELGGAD